MDERAVATTERSAPLATAYAAAHYFVTIGHREWLFCVGQQAEDIERQLGAEHYLFITAWNPPLAAATHAQNLAADQRLQAQFQGTGYRCHSALGSDARGGAVEHGWVVLDVQRETADAWAREFGQAATLYWRRGEAVRLRMLWPRPQDMPDHPHIDWVG